MAFRLNDLDAGKIHYTAIGRVWPSNLDFFGPKWHHGPCNGCCPHQNHNVPRHINNKYINRYNLSKVKTQNTVCEQYLKYVL